MAKKAKKQNFRNNQDLQHIEKATPICGNDESSLINLLLTNEKHQLLDIVHHAPLGKGDR